MSENMRGEGLEIPFGGSPNYGLVLGIKVSI